MSDRRLDPTKLPRYFPGVGAHATSPNEGRPVYHERDEDLEVSWTVGFDGSYCHCASFRLPLDILTEEQVIEILKRNRCPVP